MTISKFKIIKLSIKLSRFFFGNMLITENQPYDFSWDFYIERVPNTLSSLIALNLFYHDPNIDIESVAELSKSIIMKHSQKKINRFKEKTFTYEMPTDLSNYNVLKNKMIYCCTTNALIEGLLFVSRKNRLPISDNNFQSALIFLSYKKSVAAQKISYRQIYYDFVDDLTEDEKNTVFNFSIEKAKNLPINSYFAAKTRYMFKNECFSLNELIDLVKEYYFKMY